MLLALTLVALLLLLLLACALLRLTGAIEALIAAIHTHSVALWNPTDGREADNDYN